MPTSLRRTLALLLLATLETLPLSATCGGGGGGGTGGVRSVGGGPGGGGQTYQVPWTVLREGQKPAPTASLVLYWFPSSPTEAKGSDLQSSRTLALLTSRCVAMSIVPTDNAALYSQLAAGQHSPLAVLATADGKEIGRIAGERGVSAREVEKLLDAEVKRRESAANQQLDAAKQKEKGGDLEGAAGLYRAVWAEHCLLPDSGRKAAKALRKIGRPLPDDQAAVVGGGTPRLGGEVGSRMVRTMNDGLAAEDAGRYGEAGALYEKAHRLDPADPVPLRYLGELARHHTGEWERARRSFRRILAMPADPISRAVALHGLGKMTIHGGDFAAGLGLIEESVVVYPLALAYRNLAVYWNSAGELAKARGFAARALALDPEDPYNQVFSATFAAEDGRREEALRVARANEDLLAASYNLAAIYALLGQRDKALGLLHRHFWVYERYDAVRAKEMKEAREDSVFAGVKADAAFVTLTAQAEQPAAAHAMPGGQR